MCEELQSELGLWAEKEISRLDANEAGIVDANEYYHTPLKKVLDLDVQEPKVCKGKEQAITIAGSSTLDKTDVERMVKDLEDNAVETKYYADALVYETEQSAEEEAKLQKHRQFSELLQEEEHTILAKIMDLESEKGRECFPGMGVAGISAHVGAKEEDVIAVLRKVALVYQ